MNGNAYSSIKTGQPFHLSREKKLCYNQPRSSGTRNHPSWSQPLHVGSTLCFNSTYKDFRMLTFILATCYTYCPTLGPHMRCDGQSQQSDSISKARTVVTSTCIKGWNPVTSWSGEEGLLSQFSCCCILGDFLLDDLPVSYSRLQGIAQDNSRL